MYRVVRNGFKKISILWVSFTSDDGICNPEISFVWWFYKKKNVSSLLVKSGPFWDMPFEVSKNQAFQKSEIADFCLKFLICSRNT